MCFVISLLLLWGNLAEAGDGDAAMLLLSHPVNRLGRTAVEEAPSLLESEMTEASLADTEAALEQRAHAGLELVEMEVTIPDVDSMVHVNTPESEIVSSGVTIGYKFGADGETLNKLEQCYIEHQRTSQFSTPDNIENTMRDAYGQLNSDGTARGDWAKCLPPPMYTLLTMESFQEGDIESGDYENKMKPATDFYTTLKWLHNEACAHIRLNIADPALQQRIKDEINNHAEMDVGHKIADAVGVVAGQIVRQYRSLDPGLNQGNAYAIAGLDASVAEAEAAITAALHADFITIQDIGGMPSVRRRLEELQRNVQTMTEKIDDIKTFMETRPTYAARLSDDYSSSRRRNKKADGLLDTVQNVGMCGVKGSQPNDNSQVFEAHGFETYTLSLGLSSAGEILIDTKDGMRKPGDVAMAANTTTIAEVLPGGTITEDNHLPSYQDDLFAQGNLACGAREDGLWTIVTSDRDNASNPVTTTQEEGYFCVWVLDDVTVLPENQRNGFSNTEFVAESPSKMAEALNGRQDFYESFFPDDGEYKFYHCHYTPRNSGAVRVHSFQHQAERHYPGAIRQICGCDWRKLGMLVSRCDCTLDGEANGGCRKAEMEMLNEHTQTDLWAAGNAQAPSQVALSHAELAHGKIVSHDYDDGDIQVRAFQDATGRVRRTGSNNAVCSVDDLGKPDVQARSYQRRITLQSPDNSTHRRRRRNPMHTFFTDVDMDGIMALPDCRQHSVERGDCVFANYSDGEPEEFGLRDFQSKRWFSRQGLPYMAVPSGGVNTEFFSSDGAPCDALNLNAGCKIADASGYTGEDLTKLLVSFCDTPASLYKVPSENGKAPEGFGKVEMPLPLLDGSNYRAYARANFGRSGNGTWLHCPGGMCSASDPAPAAQGILDPDELVASLFPSGKFKGFSIMVGGATNMSQPSVVPMEWYDKASQAFGIFNKDVADTFGSGANGMGNHSAVIQAKIDAKIQAALEMVAAEEGRRSGVTCSNGKYVYVRQGADGSWPVVSTIREGYNRDGPRPDRGSFGCRFLGVFCNDNNCNNNGDQDVPGPFNMYSYKNSHPYVA